MTSHSSSSPILNLSLHCKRKKPGQLDIKTDSIMPLLPTS